MAQFTKYIERTFDPPPLVRRAFQVLIPAAWVAKAITTHRLEDVLTAVFFVALMLPAGIAPKALHARLTAWERDRPFVSDVLSLLLMTCATFLILRWFLDRTPSAVIAIAAGLVGVVAGRLRRRRRTRTVRRGP